MSEVGLQIGRHEGQIQVMIDGQVYRSDEYPILIVFDPTGDRLVWAVVGELVFLEEAHEIRYEATKQMHVVLQDAAEAFLSIPVEQRGQHKLIHAGFPDDPAWTQDAMLEWVNRYSPEIAGMEPIEDIDSLGI